MQIKCVPSESERTREKRGGLSGLSAPSLVFLGAFPFRLTLRLQTARRREERERDREKETKKKKRESVFVGNKGPIQ